MQALERCSPPNTLGQFLPVSPSENVSLWLMGLLTEEQRHSAEVVHTASRSQPFAIHSVGEEKTQEEERIVDYAKGGHIWLLGSGACASASAFGRLQLWTRRCQSAEVDTKAP